MMTRVLLIDDDTALLQALPEAVRIRMPEIQVDICETAPAALHQISVVDYDSIVSDIKMPEMDGLTLMERIKTVRPHTPTILISGHMERDLAVAALRHGAYAFIPKPIDREFFVAWLIRAIEVRRLNREVQAQRAALELHANELEQAVQERTRELREEIAERRRAEARLRESEEQLRFTLNAAQIGTWDWSFETGVVRWSENLARIHGLEPSRLQGTFESFCADVHPEDLKQVQTAIQAAIEGNGDFHVEYRLAPKHGRVVWVEATGRVIYDAEHRPMRMTGVCMDVTARKLDAAAPRRREGSVVKIRPDVTGRGGNSSDPRP